MKDPREYKNGQEWWHAAHAPDADMHADICARLDAKDAEIKALKNAPPCSPSEEYLVAENRELRRAGCKLAEAALHVAREYDGVHRLLLAVSEWSKALADEGGRGKMNAVVTGSGAAITLEAQRREGAKDGRCCRCGYDGLDQENCTSEEGHCCHWWDGDDDTVERPANDMTMIILRTRLQASICEIAAIGEVLVRIHSALNDALGDTNPSCDDDMTDGELRHQEPLFWAAAQVAKLIHAQRREGE